MPVSVEVRDVSAPDGAGLLVGERPWRAPRGLTPDPAYLGWLFTTGARLSYDGTWPAEVTPYTVSISPGSYLVQVSQVRFFDNPDHTLVAAARLVVRDVPVQSWEMALQAGSDMRILPDRGLFGFDVDAGAGCFYDASGTATFNASEWLRELHLAGEVDYTVLSSTRR